MDARAGRPVLVFDGDCGFCTSSARFMQRRVLPSGSALVAPWQGLNLAELGLTQDQCRAAVQWVGAGDGVGSGQPASGHAAIAAALRAGHPVWRPVGALLVAPGISWLAERVYAWVARHRHTLGRCSLTRFGGMGS